MNEHIIAQKAIASVYIKSIIQPIFTKLFVVIGILTVLTIYLGHSVSSYWYILVGLFAAALTFVIVGKIAFTLLMKRITPDMNVMQQASIKEFVLKVQSLIDLLTTPYFITASKIAISSLRMQWGRSPLMIIAHDSSKLEADYQSIVKTFKKLDRH